MTRTITAFEASPDKGQGLARDMTVRWALAELELSYEVRLLSFAEMKEAAHLAAQPFGQIPTYQDGDLSLFESGAIVWHLAERHGRLLPVDANARARAVTWMFAAVSTIEPPIIQREVALYLERDKPWHAERMTIVEQRIHQILASFSARLGQVDWLDGAFSAGDLMVVQVLRRLEKSGLLDVYPNVSAYVARGEARPAFHSAFAAQLAIFQARPGPD